MESPISMTAISQPAPIHPVNVTDVMEERNFERAIHAIDSALENYLPAFSNEASGVFAGGYYWVHLGEIPLSSKLKEAILLRYTVTCGSLRFVHWNTLHSKFDDLRCPNAVKSERASFVGFPLPEEAEEDSI